MKDQRARNRTRWNGEPPSKGDELKAPRRRVAYVIDEIEASEDPVYRLIFRCWRIEVREISPVQRVHTWHWDPRQKKGRPSGGTEMQRVRRPR